MIELYLQLAGKKSVHNFKQVKNMNKKFYTIILLTFFTLIGSTNCIWYANWKLGSFVYPENPSDAGFPSGSATFNESYFKGWCAKYCEDIKVITSNALGGDYILEVKGRVDASGDPKANEKLAQGRAEAIKGALAKNGIKAERMKAVPDLDYNNYFGKDKFDPANRRVTFKLIQGDKAFFKESDLIK